MRDRTQQRTSSRIGRRVLALLAALLVFGVVSGSAAWAAGRSRPLDAPGAAATTAQALRSLVGDDDPRVTAALLPPDFGAVMGYRPVVVRSGGRDVLERASGSCSSPFGDTRYDFSTACRQHDLGYDLLRYADRTGHPLGGWARAAVDQAFHRHLDERCAGLACAAAAAVYAGAVDVNSVRQLYRVPAVETPLHWGLAAAAGALVLLLGWWRALRTRLAGAVRATARATARTGRRVPVGMPMLLGSLGLGASLVPTILPRPVLVQAVVSALVAVQLVAVGALGSRVLRTPAGLSRAVLRRGVGALALAAVVAGVVAGHARSAQLLAGMGQPAPSLADTALAAGLAVALAAVLLMVLVAACRGLAWTVRAAWRSRRIRVALLVPVLAAGSTVGFAAPHDPPSGSDVPGKGQRYLAHALTAEQISRVTGRPARQPIRAYVGLRAAAGPQARADLAVRRLEQAGGFDRAAVLVLLPTGSGWVDPAAVGSAEYLYGGDVASVAVQYDDVPSWVAYLKGSGAGRETATALLDAVRRHVDGMPAGHRPRVLLFGESLGALAGLRGPVDRADAALWVGVPGPARERAQQVSVSASQQVLVHPDDPVAAWSPELAWRDTAQWHRTWVPGLSFWQGVGDLVSAYWTPDGYGHRYSTEMVDAWVRAAQPSSPGSPPAARLERVRAAVGELAAVG